MSGPDSGCADAGNDDACFLGGIETYAVIAIIFYA